MCPHQPPCPPADRPDRHAAHTVAFHPEQGWSLLCNGVIAFDDMGEILPGGRVRPPHRPAPVRLPAAACGTHEALAMRQIRSATGARTTRPGRHFRAEAAAKDSTRQARLTDARDAGPS